MKTEATSLCCWCDNHECLLNQAEDREITGNVFPEITDCLDYRDYRCAKGALNNTGYCRIETKSCDKGQFCNHWREDK